MVGKQVNTESYFLLVLACLIFHYISETNWDLPVANFGFQMVASANSLFAIGGRDSEYQDTTTIFKLTCTGDVDTCEWIESDTALKYGRRVFVAMTIPDDLLTWSTVC